MANLPGKSKSVSFARVFPVLLAVAILFQLLLAKDQIKDLSSAVNIILKTMGSSLFVSLIAAGAFVLFARKEED